MPLALKLVIYAVVVVIGLALTRAPEVRYQRWWKIPLALGFTMPIVWIMGLTMTLEHRGVSLGHLGIFLLCLGVLIALWVPNLSFTIADSVSKFFYGEANPNASYRTDYRRAKMHVRDGELKEALKATQWELEKDPTNYEGLLLLASIYEQMNLPANAIIQLDIVLNNSEATGAQKDVAAAEKEKCEQLARHLQAVGRKKSPFA